MAWPKIAARLLFLGHVAVGKGPQERDDGKLLPLVQFKIPQLGCVDVDRYFRSRPPHARNIPRIVEVNDLLKEQVLVARCQHFINYDLRAGVILLIQPNLTGGR